MPKQFNLIQLQIYQNPPLVISTMVDTKTSTKNPLLNKYSVQTAPLPSPPPAPPALAESRRPAGPGVKPRPNDHNIQTQHIVTLLGVWPPRGDVL